MNAAAQRHPSDEKFVGQVLKRSSPVLTWRPALAARLREEEMEAKSVPAPHESSVRLSLSRFSKLTTRRMEALPVVSKVARSRHARAGVWSVTVRVVLGAIVGSLLAVLAILLVDARGNGGVSATGPFAIKESSAQAYDAPMDTLAAALVAPAAPTASTVPAAPAATAAVRAPIAASTHTATASAAHAALRAHATHAVSAHAARAHRTPAKHR
jgi:hypothetical protein